MRQLFVVGLLATCLFIPLRLTAIVAAPDDAAQSAADGDDEKLRQAAERFLVVLEKTPRRGTALDRLYGYHVEAGTLEAFVKTFEDRTAKNAKDGAAWMILGLIESQRGRDAAAVAAFAQAAKTLPDNPLASFYLGQSLVLVGQPEEAAAAFEQAISRKPARADLLDMFQALGRVYQRAQKSDQALAVWTRLEKLFPDDLRVQEQIASTLVEEGQHAQALPRFEALAAKVKDEYREATYRIEAADLKVRLGQSKEALVDFEKLLSKLNPDNWLYRDVRRRIDDVFLRTDDQTGLAAYYETWVGKNQEDVDAMGRLARILAGLGRTPEAQTWLDKALKLAPSRKDLRLALIEQLLAEKQFGRAIAQYELLAKNDPNNPDTLRDWGRLILKDTSKPEAERKQAAAAVWRRLIEARPKDSLTVTQVADLFRQSEMVDEALGLYKKAIELSPDAAQYREYLGEYYHTLKRSDEALAVWREIVAGNNHTAENLARLAEVLAGFGYLPEGVGYILEACKLDHDEFKYPLKAAELLSRSEKYDDALKQLDAADKLADSPENSEMVLQQRIRNLELADALEREIVVMTKELAANRSAPARWYLLARYQEAARHFAEADQAIGQALALDEKSVVYRTAAARIAEAAGNLQGAADAYRALAVIDRRSRTGHLTNIAKLEAQLGRAEQALSAGRELLAAAPGSLEHYEFFAQLCFRLGKVEQGLDALRRSARMNPGEPRALVTLANALAEQFRNDEAIELYWRAFDKSNGLEGKLPVVVKLAELHLQANHFDRLVERLNRLRREAQAQREATICLAQAYQAAGDYGTARQELERLLTENTRDAALLLQLSNLAESEGDLTATIKYQQQLFAVSPGKEVELRLAQLLLRAGETEAAASIWGRLAAAEEDPTTMLAAIDSLLGHGSNDLALAITDQLLRDQPQNWELLYREGAALAQSKPDEAVRRFRDILALQFPDDERGARAKSLGPGRGRRQAAAAQPSNTATNTVSPNVIRFAGFTMQDRSGWANHIRSVVGLDNRNQNYGWGRYGGGFGMGSTWGYSGRQSTFWSPNDFGQARMAALGWLLHLAQGRGKTEEFLREQRPAAEKADPGSRDLWDWYYLQLVRQDEKERYEAVRRLSRTGDLVGEWLFLESLSERPAADQSKRQAAARRNRNRNRNRADKTPPLPADELEHVLACYQSVRQKRPDLLSDPDHGTSIIRNVLAELKRADRGDDETALYRSAVEAADRARTRLIALDLAAARGDFDTAVAQFGAIAEELGADALNNQAAATLSSAAQAVTSLMAARGKAGAHADVLQLLDRYLACAACEARSKVLSRHGRAAAPNSNFGGTSYAAVWVGRQARHVQFDYPTPNDYFDQNAISVLRQSYELYQRDDLLSDLVAHCRQQTETGPAADRLWWRLALAYLDWWRDEKDAAIGHLVRVVEQALQDQNLRMELAEIYAQRDDLALALETADKIIPSNHEMLQRRETMALRLAVRTGNPERARRAAERLFGLRLDAETQMQLASEMRQLGMHDLAEGVLGRARRQAGNRMDALVSLMQRYQADQKVDSALEVAYLLLRQAPAGVQQSGGQGYDSAAAARTQAIAVLVNSGRLKDLIERVEQQIKAAPESVKLHQTLVEYYEAAGDKKQQLETLKRIANLRPDDQKLRIQVAEQIFATGKAADALEHYRTAFLKEPALLSKHIQEALPVFQRAKKVDELLKLLDDIQLKTVDGQQAALHIAQMLYQDEKQREQALKLFRRLWQEFPDQRETMLQGFRNDDVLQMPEVYDFARDVVFPKGADPLADPWSGLDQSQNSWNSWRNNTNNSPLLTLIEIALKQNRLPALRDEVEQALARFPGWKGGRALLVVIHARNHRPERAVPLLEALVGDEDSPLPATLCGILAGEIENFGVTRPWAFKLYETRFNRLDAFEEDLNSEWQNLLKLMTIYQSQRQISKGRDLIHRISQIPIDNEDDAAAVAQHRYQWTFYAGFLYAQFKLPVDAVRTYRSLFDDEDLTRQLAQSGDTDSLQQVRQYYARALKLLVKEDPREALAVLLEPGASAMDPRQGPVVNLVMGVEGKSPERKQLNSLLVKTLRAVAARGELKPLVRTRTAELAQQRPDDLAAHILAALAAIDDGPADAIREACGRLASLVDRTPLEELPAGTKANARQRILAARQVGLWLVARECRKLSEQRALGEKLAARALEAARRQNKRGLAGAMLREWGQFALDQGDRKAGEALWTEQLQFILDRPLKSVVPATSNLKFENIRGLTPPARQENGKSIQPLTVQRFGEVVALARRAGDCGLHNLSLLCLREAFEAGPPIADNENNQNAARGASHLNSSFNVAGDASSQQPNSAVETALAELVGLWNRTKVPAVAQYELLAAAVLPSARPVEIFLYPQPLAPAEFRRPRSAGRLLAMAAVKAERVDDLRKRIAARQDQPLAQVAALVLLAQLAVETGDDAASHGALDKLLEHVQADPLENSAELSCHVALPLLAHERLEGPASAIVALAAQRLSVVSQQQQQGGEPSVSLYLKLAGRQLDRGDLAGARTHIQKLLDISQKSQGQGNGGMVTFSHQQQLQKVAGEYARVGLVGEGLDTLGQIADLPVQDDEVMVDLGETLSLLARAALRLPARERYELLKTWTLPAADRQLVRILGGETLPNDSPESFRPLALWNKPAFVRAAAGEAPAGSATKAAAAGESGEISTAGLLIDAAREARQLDALAQELSEIASRDEANAAALALLVRLEAGDATVPPEIKKVLEAAVQPRKPPDGAEGEDAEAESDDDPKTRKSWADYLLARACLGHPELKDLGERRLKQIAEDQGAAPASRPSSGHIERDLAGWIAKRDPHAVLGRGMENDLAHWSDVAQWHVSKDSSGQADIDNRLPAWVAHEGHIARLAGAASDLVYFNYPLTGDFEFSADVLLGGSGGGSIGYGGLVFDAFSENSAQADGLDQWSTASRRQGRNSRGSGGVWPMQNHERLECIAPLTRPGEFNRLTLRVAADRIRFLVNGHPVHELARPPRISPFLSLFAPGSELVVFRNLTLTGDVRIPDKVPLTYNDELEGWVIDGGEGEAQPDRLTRLIASAGYRAAIQADDQDQDQDDEADEAEEADATNQPASDEPAWSARDGIIRARKPDELDAGRFGQSELSFHRPLRNGESLSYEFLYEPGETEVHPTMDRLVFLLQPKGVRLHWITPGDQEQFDPWSGLYSNNIVDELQHRRGPDQLPLKAGEWNRLTLSLAEDNAILELNGIEIYRRPLEPANHRTFGFFRDPGRTGVQVRSVVLKGDWPAALTAQQTGDLLASRAGAASESVRRTRQALLGEEALVQNWEHVQERARTLPPAARYKALLEWVYPGPDHATFRLQGGFTPVLPPPVSNSAQPAVEKMAGKRRVQGGELTAPIFDLIDVARELKKLDELASLAKDAKCETDFDRRCRLAVLALVATARGNSQAAIENLAQLKPLLDNVAADTHEYQRWPEFIACTAALRDQKLVRPALDLLERMSMPLEPKAGSSAPNWTALSRAFGGNRLAMRRYLAQAGANGFDLDATMDQSQNDSPSFRRSIRVLRDRIGEVSSAPRSGQPSKQWFPVTHGTAQSRGQGASPGQWRTSKGEAQHTAGHDSEYLYFQSPLSGEFEVSCRLTAASRFDMQPGYSETWVALMSKGDKYEVGHFGRMSPTRTIAPPLADLAESCEYRLIVRNESHTIQINGKKIHEQLLPQNCDPWLVLHAQPAGGGSVRDLRIIGKPAIPETLGLLELSDLTGWMADYYGESTGDNGDWKKDGDELTGSQPLAKGAGVRQSLLRYHRPLLEDGQIEYEFYYEAGKTHVHPALDRLAFLVEPNGIRLHWLTDAQFDRSGLAPNNVADEIGQRRGPEKLPLREAEWNHLRLAVKGDIVSLWLNDVDVYERPLESANQRIFGLFHDGGQTAVRVRKVTFRGAWPRALPALADQELAAP